METRLPIKDEIEIERHELTKKLIQNQLKGNPIKEYLIPLGSLLVAFLGVWSGVYAQYLASQATIRAAALNAQQSGYSKLLTALDVAQNEKLHGSLQNQHLHNIRQAYYDIELFIPESRREETLRNIEDLIRHLSVGAPGEPGLQEYLNARRKLRTSLQQSFTK
jgi:uncharacterized membrane protein YccC